MSGVSDYRRKLAWEAGYRARDKGKPKSKNDRQPCTIYHDDWADGWNYADQVDPHLREPVKGDA